MIFTHLAPVAFLILGLAFVNLMVNITALVANKNQVKFYWPHTAFCFITFFTMLLFWWTCYPLNNIDYFPNEGWNLFTYLLFLAVPMLMFMICEVLTPHNTTEYAKSIDLKEYYYQYHRIIIGLALALQICLIGNFFVFYAEDYDSMKVIGRVVMLCIMLPMVISANRRLHEIGMGIFFAGFIYTIVKYHIWMVYL
jgi:hypothetical protein|tara:strand:+ start:410 stop:997 length:588 start_codon:yes stop_codon:yes gene_type:complete